MGTIGQYAYRKSYIIWQGLITRKLTNITHILTRNNQFGYKEGISTIDAIIKIEHYVERANRDAKILPMGLSKAFGAINRTLLWATLYERDIHRNGKTPEEDAEEKNYHRNTKGCMGNSQKTILDYFKDQPSARCYS